MGKVRRLTDRDGSSYYLSVKLILQIAAGVLLAKLIWLIGELIMAGAAIDAIEQALRTPPPFAPMKAQPSMPKPAVLSIPSPPPPTPKLPTYPFPTNFVPAGSLACMSGITLRKEDSGWTQLGGTTKAPTCTTP